MIVWWNGTLVPIDSVRISPFDRGFLYGDGVFETIRIQNGEPLWLSEHLDRLKGSLTHLNFGSVPEFFEEEGVRRIIHELVRANPGLGNVARLKIIVTRGNDPLIALPKVNVDPRDGFSYGSPTMLFMATPYQPPSEEAYREGWAVELVSGRYSPPLGRHKTLNYLFYLWLREEARRNGFQEAIFEDCEGRVVEAATASLVVLIEGVWVFPVSPWKLGGVTEAIVARILQESGEQVMFKPITRKDLIGAHAVWLLNSLIGIMPISRLNEHSLRETMSLYASQLRKQIIQSNYGSAQE